eukprot:s36_g52.t1
MLFRGGEVEETLKLATQRTLMLGEIPSDSEEPEPCDADRELDVPFGTFVCNNCFDPNEKSALQLLVDTWCDRRIQMDDCHKLDPDMQNSVQLIVSIDKSLKDTIRAKHEMVQEEEQLKQKLSAAVQAMKKRQYTLCVQHCPERNPDDTEDYIKAVQNIHDWEQRKLDAHRDEILKLEDMEMTMKTKRLDAAEAMARIAHDIITKADLACKKPKAIEIELKDTPGSPDVDPDLMKELEGVVVNHDKAGCATYCINKI